MTDVAVVINIHLDEDDVIQANVRLDRIKAIAETLMIVDREGHSDELDQHTVQNLMETIDTQANEAKRLLRY